MVQRRQLVLFLTAVSGLLAPEGLVWLAVSWWSSMVEAWPLVQLVDRCCLTSDLVYGYPYPGLPAFARLMWLPGYCLVGFTRWH